MLILEKKHKIGADFSRGNSLFEVLAGQIWNTEISLLQNLYKVIYLLPNRSEDLDVGLRGAYL